ncbi:MAG: Fur family transcriptional regulator [Syntrophomonadaceae bacterium]|jgi:Fe2+ or Zn2+ uptake regulation protein
MDIANLKNKLKVKGLKMTKPRQTILTFLIKEPGWVTAKSLHDRLADENLAIDFSTVCRNLDALTHTGILCRVDRDNNGVFVYALREIQEHHHHLICRCCGKISPIDYCPLEQIDSSHSQGFDELFCRFELYGTCRDCQIK